MGKRRRDKCGDDEEKEQVTHKFSPESRHAYLTGFRKRKIERKHKGNTAVAELERQDKIQVRKEHRESVRATYKQVQREAARIGKIWALGDERPRALKDREAEEGGEALEDRGKHAQEDDGDDEESEESTKEPRSVVSFEEEENDPFGGCDVTTTEGFNIVPVNSNFELAKESTRHRINNDPEAVKRRKANLAKEEAKRKVAMLKHVKSTLEQKKREGKKTKKKSNKEKAKTRKTGAKERRIRAKRGK